MNLQAAVTAILVSTMAIVANAQTNDQAFPSTTGTSSSTGNSSKTTIEKLHKTDKEWRKQLTRIQYEVTRQGGTERAYTGKYWRNKQKGTYRCVCCDLELFSSETKFMSGTGWPSFYAPVNAEHLTERLDRSMPAYGTRVEILCRRCDAHLGHVFNDGPRPTGLRYCMNSAALNFETEAETKRRQAREQEANREVDTDDDGSVSQNQDVSDGDR